MRYGKKPTGGMWVMSVQLRQTPRCPGCCEELQGIVVEIRNGWAWCPVCVGTLLHRSKPIRHALAMDCFRKHATLQHGLRFYTPEPVAGNVHTAYEWAERANYDKDLDTVPVKRDGVYALTPAGEHLLADLDVGGLLEVEATTRAVRARNQSRTS